MEGALVVLAVLALVLLLGWCAEQQRAIKKLREEVHSLQWETHTWKKHYPPAIRQVADKDTGAVRDSGVFLASADDVREADDRLWGALQKLADELGFWPDHALRGTPGWRKKPAKKG